MTGRGADDKQTWRIIEFPPHKRPISRFVRQDLTDHQQKKVVAYLRKCLQHPDGPSWNSYKFKKLTGHEDIWEMKPGGQVRLLGFFPPSGRRTFVLTNAFIKKQDRTPRREIEKAERIRQEFLEAKEGGQ